MTSKNYNYSDCYDSLFKLTKKIFYEKNIVFKNAYNFWSIQVIIFALVHIFADNRNKNEKSEYKRVIMNLPPRHYKSLVANVIFSSWMIGQDSSSRIIIASHNRRLSMNHLSDIKDIICNSSAFIEQFPNIKIHKKNNRSSDFKVDGGGFILAVSIASGAIGFGADFIIVDDPHNPSDIYSHKRLKSTNQSLKYNLFSRLNNFKTSSMLVLMQRLHVDDLTGSLLKSGNWKQISIPLISEEKRIFKIFNEEIEIEKDEILNDEIFDHDLIKELKSEIGVENFNAQYQQSPSISDTAMITEDMIEYFEEEEKNSTKENYIINNNPYFNIQEIENNIQKNKNTLNISSNINQNNNKNYQNKENNDVLKNNSFKNYKKYLIDEKNYPMQIIKSELKVSENVLKYDL
jgi:hypothetical protein